MKRKAIAALLMVAIMALSVVGMFAQDGYLPEEVNSMTARFFLVEHEELGDEFSMESEDGELVINIIDSTPIYFEDYVPLSDECEELTKSAREVLFGRTLAEVLEGRNLRVTFEDSEQSKPTNIVILFEGIVALPQDIDPLDLVDDSDYIGIVTLPEEIEWEDFYPISLNGEIVVNNELLEGTPFPFLHETEDGDVVMVPLRVVADALGYDVSWNGYLRSVQLGVGIHLWIDSTEVHYGRMAPIEISTAPIIVDNITFVPLDFFRDVLGQTAYVFEGQVVIETYSDMM